jgi:ankyrin repeat protein
MKMNCKDLLAVSVIAPSTLLASFNLEASTVPIYLTAQLVQSQSSAQTKEAPNQKTAQAKSPSKPEKLVKPLPPPSRETLNFFKAVEAGNIEMADKLLQSGADINCRNCTPNGRTLIFASYSHVFGHKPSPTLVWLLAKGADPNIPDNEGVTLLMQLAGSGNVTNPWWSGIDDFEYLLRSGADVRIKDNEENTALHYLAKKAPGDALALSQGGHGDAAFEYVKLWRRAFEGLIAQGADINAVNKGGDTPLMYVVGRSCNPYIVETLLKYGASPSTRNKAGQSALDIAIDVASRNSLQSCNRVVEILESPQAALVSQQTQAQKTRITPSVVESASEWTGIFRATKPRRGDASVSVRIEPSGALTFKSSSGLHGSGEMSSQEGQMTASVKAISPKDANGKPVFGANEIIFNMTGQIKNGVMKGDYKSIVESGTFILCSPEARQDGSQCDTPPSGNPLGGLLDSLRTLSGK